MPEAFFGPPIYAYSREKAISEGMLIDVTTTAVEAGFNYPVAITRVVWNQYVVVPSGVTDQDLKGRLWDILSNLYHAIKSRKEAGSTLIFTVYVKQAVNRKPIPVNLKSIVGPGDDPNPVMTIMEPDES